MAGYANDPDAFGEAAPLFALCCARPLLVARFATPQTTLSWAMARPGFQLAREVAWVETSDAELGPDVDAFALLRARLGAGGLSDAVAMMTARDVRRHRLADAECGGARVSCVATVGLANAARVGGRRRPERVGTINLLAAVSVALTEAALVEASSIATEARTAAVIDLDRRVDGEVATGTGTDCVVVAAPSGGEPRPFAGLHTDVGTALGRAVYDAVLAGGREWIAQKR